MQRTASEEDNKRIIMDIDVLVKSFNFPYIVRCLGYFIRTVRKSLYMKIDFIVFELFRLKFLYVWN